MKRFIDSKRFDLPLLIGIILLISFSTLSLFSIARHIFPGYFLYLVLAFFAFYIFSKIDFDIISLFSKHFYVLSILFLLLTIILGQVTRGAVRWIPIGPLSLQSAEIVKPFLIVFFANYLASGQMNIKRFIKAGLLLFLPAFLILIQPSLGVSVLLVTAFVGVLLASQINKKYIMLGLFVLLALVPLAWNLMAPYQQTRITNFLDPNSDPLGGGYNSIQSMIAVGSGKVFGRGLGMGVQTQLAFLPEKHTDFVFASVSEEMGFMGAGLLLLGSFFILSRLVRFINNSASPAARAYLAGIFLTLFVQVFINIGMNLGMMPITGLPLPLVSAGGSSMLGTMIALGIANSTRKTDRGL